MSDVRWGTQALDERPIRTSAYRTAEARSRELDVAPSPPLPLTSKPQTSVDISKSAVDKPQQKQLRQMPENQLPIPADGMPSLWQAVSAVRQVLIWGGTLTMPGEEPILGWGSEHAVNVATMWAAHTNVRFPCSEPDHVEKGMHASGDPGKVALRATPRLGLFAIPSENSLVGEGSGKTHLARLLGAFCAVPTLETSPTGAAMARIIGVMHATMFLDEAAGYFTNRKMEMSKEILENGYTQSWMNSMSGSTRRMWGNSLYTVENFGPAALVTVSNPKLEGSKELRPLMSRFITIRFKQAPKGYRPPVVQEKDAKTIEGIAVTLQKRIMPLASMLREATFAMPEYMTPREAEIWESLLLCAAVTDQDRADYGARYGVALEPIWVPRMLAAADWMINDGEGKEKARQQWADFTSGPWNS